MYALLYRESEGNHKPTQRASSKVCNMHCRQNFSTLYPEPWTCTHHSKTISQDKPRGTLAVVLNFQFSDNSIALYGSTTALDTEIVTDFGFSKVCIDNLSCVGVQHSLSVYINSMLCWQHCTLFLLESYAFNINTCLLSYIITINVYAMMRGHFFKLRALLNAGLFLSRCPKSLQVMLVIFYDHCWEFWRNFQINTRRNGVVTSLKQSVRGISGIPYWYI